MFDNRARSNEGKREIEASLHRLQSTINQREFEMAQLAAQVDREQLWKLRGYKSLDEWISVSAGVSKAEDDKRARVARTRQAS